MSIKLHSLVYWLLVVAAFAIMLAAMFFTTGGLLSAAHHSRLSDYFIYAGTAMAIIMAIAIVGTLAIWAIQASKYVVVYCLWVPYIWVLIEVKGEPAVTRRRKHT